MPDAQYLLDRASDCFRLVRDAREQADRLEAIANDLMAQAVEIDTIRDRTAPRRAKRD